MTTDGDASRFLGSEAGKRATHTLTASEAAGADVPTAFPYLVGVKQLQVSYRVTLSGVPIWVPLVDEGTLLASAELTTADPHFVEKTSTSVAFKNLPAGTVLLFQIPHTSIPAELKERVLVRDQGSNEAIELLGNGDGILLRSGSGKKYLLRVDDSGTVGSEPR